MSKAQENLKYLAGVAVFALIYLVPTRLCLGNSLSPSNLLPPWAGSGIALAGLLLFGWRFWPGIWLGTFAAYTMAVHASPAGATWSLLATNALIASGNSLMAIASFVLITSLHGWKDGNDWRGPLFAKVDALKFSTVAFGVCLISAGLGSGAICAAGIAPWREYPLLGFVWWLGDVAGFLIMTPFLLTWAKVPGKALSLRLWASSILAIGLLYFNGRMVYSGWYTSQGHALPIAFLIIPPLAWLALRCGPWPTTTSVVLLSAVATWYTAHHLGPLAIATDLGSQILLRSFLLTLAIPAQALESYSSARRKAEAEVKALNATLERRIQERMLELERSYQELRESEERFNAFMRNLPGVAFMKDAQGRYIYASDRVNRVVGLSSTEVLGMNVFNFWPADAPRVTAQDAEMRSTGRPIQTVETLPMQDGLHYWLMHKFPIPDSTGKMSFIGGMAIDITARIVAEQKVEAALKKEEVLKREIHHRVKNNLQVVISMLYLQSAEIADPRAREILLECQSRTRSIALIYALLSESENLTRIEFLQYARRLTADLLTAYRTSPEIIAVTIEAEGVFLSVDASLPCGLILTELVSNSLKHAFPEGRRGKIAIDLHPSEDGLFKLTVQDNGVGLPAGFDLENPRTLGYKLVRDLTRQLDGKITCSNHHGAAVTVSFPQNSNTT